MDSWTILFLFSMINLAILFSIIRYIPYPTIVNKFSTKYSYERNRNAVLSSTLPLAAIFPRVSTFYFDVRFIPAPPEETGTPFFRLFRNNPSFSFLEHRKPRSSIFRGNLGFHSAACRYLHQSSSSPFFSGQLTISFKWHIWSTPFYSTPEFRLSSSFRATVQSWQYFSHLLAPPLLLWRGKKPHRRAISTSCRFAVWSRSRGIKHREILSKNENFSCIDNTPLPLFLSLFFSWKGICSLSNTFWALYKYI